MAVAGKGQVVQVKGRCCHSTPRCKRCPVVWRRLARAGLVVRVSAREYEVVSKVRKPALERARRS